MQSGIAELAECLISVNALYGVSYVTNVQYNMPTLLTI